jgi:hypothetical protein
MEEERQRLKEEKSNAEALAEQRAETIERLTETLRQQEEKVAQLERDFLEDRQHFMAQRECDQKQRVLDMEEQERRLKGECDFQRGLAEARAQESETLKTRLAQAVLDLSTAHKVSLTGKARGNRGPPKLSHSAPCRVRKSRWPRERR